LIRSDDINGFIFMQERRPKESAKWLQQYFGTPPFGDTPIVRSTPAIDAKAMALPPMPALLSDLLGTGAERL